MNCLLGRQFTWNIKPYFPWKLTNSIPFYNVICCKFAKSFKGWRQHFFHCIRLEIPCKSTPQEMICMKCQVLYTLFILSTVHSRYLEFQGTLWNTSRYPYLDKTELREKYRTTTFNKYLCNWILKIWDILKILWKRGEIAPTLFHNILLPIVRFLSLGRDQIFTSR